MNRSQFVAIASSLFLAAVFSIPNAGCGGDDVLLEGSGGSGGTGGSTGTGGGGAGGAPASDAKADAPPDAKSDSATSDGAGDGNVDSGSDSATPDGAIEAARADAEAGTIDAARDAGAPDVAPDRNTVDAGRDGSAPPDAAPDSPPPVDASLDAGPDVSNVPDAAPETSVGNDANTSAADGETPDTSVVPDSSANETPDAATAVDSGSDAGFVGCDPSSTMACLASRSATCLQCAQENGCLTTTDNNGFAGTCEAVSGTAPAACNSVLGGSSAVTTSQVCLSTLKTIFASGCAHDGQEIPCLCGATEPVSCQTGGATPAGPAYPIYACEFGTSAANITGSFTDPTLGAGMADAIIQCIAAFGCDCL